ncbi:hypothetical protein GCM10022224_003270 [Nonomuraea antimicrobica]|uniref:Uncharacterized protein n=1 Tax=Nonomuraea antimicrobica TaxID=561173 RepID=A0ABP7AZ69_9ACTN
MVVGERAGEQVLVDPAAPGQDLVDGAGHLGVVGPLPRPRRQRTLAQRLPVGRDEELGAERVTHEQAVKRGGGTSQGVG